MLRFTYSKTTDINDGKPWSAGDDAELANEVACGATPALAAALLCRAGSVDDVRQRAAELGLKWWRDD